MNNIQTQIKALQRTQARIEMLREAIVQLDKISDNSDHAGLKKEVHSELSNVISGMIRILEVGPDTQIIFPPEKTPPLQTPPASSVFSEQEVAAMRLLLSRVADKVQAPNHSQTALDRGPGVPVVHSNPIERQQKAQFAMDNRYLEGKAVTITTKDGPVKGKVVGLNAPNVIVETVTGYTIPVSLTQIID